MSSREGTGSHTPGQRSPGGSAGSEQGIAVLPLERLLRCFLQEIRMAGIRTASNVGDIILRGGNYFYVLRRATCKIAVRETFGRRDRHTNSLSFCLPVKFKVIA